MELFRLYVPMTRTDDVSGLVKKKFKNIPELNQAPDGACERRLTLFVPAGNNVLAPKISFSVYVPGFAAERRILLLIAIKPAPV